MKLQQRSHATLKSKLQDHKTIVELWGKKMSHCMMSFLIFCRSKCCDANNIFQDRSYCGLMSRHVVVGKEVFRNLFED